MKRLTNEEFLIKSKNIHGDRYDYSNSVYNGSKKKIEIHWLYNETIERSSNEKDKEKRKNRS